MVIYFYVNDLLQEHYEELSYTFQYTNFRAITTFKEPCKYLSLNVKYCPEVLLIPSKNRVARNMQILQVLFLQDLQDLVLNLANLALKMKLFFQDTKSFARIL